MAESSENVVASDLKPIPKASTSDAQKNSASEIVDLTNEHE